MKIRESGMPEENTWKGFFAPERVLKIMGINNEVKDLADFGCGYGAFAIPAAKIVKGKVYAIDIEQMGWILVDKNTLKTKYDNVFAIGDVASITLDSGKPLSKAGVFAHFEAKIVADNIVREINGLRADKKYNGNAYCFLEVGYGKAGFAGGNFYAKPSPLIKMRKPGRIWHLGKILFEKYWFWRWF